MLIHIKRIHEINEFNPVNFRPTCVPRFNLFYRLDEEMCKKVDLVHVDAKNRRLTAFPGVTVRPSVAAAGRPALSLKPDSWTLRGAKALVKAVSGNVRQ